MGRSKTRALATRQRQKFILKLDQRYAATNPQWKTKAVFAGIVAFLALGVTYQGAVPFALVAAVTVPTVAALLPKPATAEWGREVFEVAFRLVVGSASGRVPGTPGGYGWLLADLGFGKPASPTDAPDETVRYWPPTRVGSWLSLAFALTVLAVLAPFGLPVAAGTAALAFYEAQVAALVHRRGTYLRDQLGYPAPDTWRVAACWESEKAVPVLRENAVKIAGAALGAGGVLAVLHLWFAVVPVAVLAAGKVFLGKYAPVYAAELATRRAEMEGWAANWAAVLGTRTPAPAFAGGWDLPFDDGSAGLDAPAKTHRLVMFSIPPGGTYDAYAAKLAEVRAFVGQDQALVMPSSVIGADGRPMAGTVDPNAFQVVYPLFTPESDKPYLEPGLDQMSQRFYLLSALTPLFASAKLGRAELTAIKALGPRPRTPGAAGPASARMAAAMGDVPAGDGSGGGLGDGLGEGVGADGEGRVRTRAHRARARAAAPKPPGVLLVTQWQFPPNSLVTPAQVIGLRDNLRSALRLDYLAIGQKRDAVTGEPTPELTIVLGCPPEEAQVSRKADLLFLAGLSWDTTFRACALTGGAGKDGPTPTLVSTEKTAVGLDRLTFSLPAGLSMEQVRTAAAKLKDATRNGYLEVVPGEPGHVVIVTGRADPLGKPLNADVNPWPLRHAEPGSIGPMDAIPFGLNDSGEVISGCLYEKHWIVAGMTGGGKSVTAQQLLAGAALMRDTKVVMLDPKRVEIGTWVKSGRVAQWAYTDVDEATALLEELLEEMRRRYDILEERDLRKIVPNKEFPLIVVYIDELAGYTSHGKASDGFNAALQLLIAQARAAGFSIIAATQKPSEKILPTAIRDNFNQALALRCKTSSHSDVILGMGSAGAGLDASRIPAGQPGLGYVLGDTAPEGSRFRSFYLDDEAIADISSRSAAAFGMTPRPRVPKAPADTGFPTIPGHIVFSEG